MREESISTIFFNENSGSIYKSRDNFVFWFWKNVPFALEVYAVVKFLEIVVSKLRIFINFARNRRKRRCHESHP